MIKLYDEDAYAIEFCAKVMHCEAVMHGEQKAYAVILDRTLFFPEEGGQSPDKGEIEGISVLDVQMQEDEIWHMLPQPLQEGSVVQGRIDWQHRFSNMQQHSGEHIFSGIVHREYGYNNVGFHLSDNGVTMDFDGVLCAEQIADIEWKVNEAISRNIPITARYPKKEELEAMEYRSKKAIEGAIRIVTIPGYDVCACCAPHVKNTGEIGMLKVMNVQNYKGGVRIHMLCGFRALLAYREKLDIVSALMALLSSSQETIVERVTQLKENAQEAKLLLGEARQEIMLAKIRDISKQEKNVIVFEEELSAPIMRNVVNELMKKHSGFCAVFAGREKSYQFIVGSAEADCEEAAKKLRTVFGAKCGGSKTMIQGSMKGAQKEVEAFFAAL